jgi:hypothetical protein
MKNSNKQISLLSIFLFEDSINRRVFSQKRLQLEASAVNIRLGYI